MSKSAASWLSLTMGDVAGKLRQAWRSCADWAFSWFRGVGEHASLYVEKEAAAALSQDTHEALSRDAKQAAAALSRNARETNGTLGSHARVVAGANTRRGGARAAGAGEEASSRGQLGRCQGCAVQEDHLRLLNFLDEAASGRGRSHIRGFYQDD